jgi:hypothetical protein
VDFQSLSPTARKVVRGFVQLWNPKPRPSHLKPQCNPFQCLFQCPITPSFLPAGLGVDRDANAFNRSILG